MTSMLSFQENYLRKIYRTHVVFRKHISNFMFFIETGRGAGRNKKQHCAGYFAIFFAQYFAKQFAGYFAGHFAGYFAICVCWFLSPIFCRVFRQGAGYFCRLIWKVRCRMILPGILPGNLPGNLPRILPGILPRNLSGLLPDILPGNLPGTLPVFFAG